MHASAEDQFPVRPSLSRLGVRMSYWRQSKDAGLPPNYKLKRKAGGALYHWLSPEIDIESDLFSIKEYIVFLNSLQKCRGSAEAGLVNVNWLEFKKI